MGPCLLACTAWQAALAVLFSQVLMTLLLTDGSGKRHLEKHMADRPEYATSSAHAGGFLPLHPKKPAPGEPECTR
ncbi:hypothetical protein ACFQ7O_33760 [Streptomyces sp. NPDC056485]|uniref:hypothetical protein n=1 Tax=Streptomyces sp. NPDC056485 TaxID=3345834 RepID=UPI0036CEE639